MMDIQMSPVSRINSLVASLPEKYQPIYGFPELSEGSSRACEDRLERILEAIEALAAELGRPLRILDLGCAQGFFSLQLAARGHSVRGVDFLQANIDVCNELAALHSLSNAKFECGSIEDAVGPLRAGQYDAVLGLSVFHHLVHQHGIDAIANLVGALAERITIGIYEVALREEPLYWAASQPADPAELLRSYAFTRVISLQETHLSGIARPLYYASNSYWFLGGRLTKFASWRQESHGLTMKSHRGTRSYYFADGLMVKRLSLKDPTRSELNLSEYGNEVAFLSGGAPAGFRAPKLIFNKNDGNELWLVREVLPGQILSELIAEHVPYSYEAIFDDLLDQLVLLENARLYHNDVRTWNILVGERHEVSLIDYGAISTVPRDCAWPDDLLLSLLVTLREIVQAHVVEPFPLRRPRLDISVLPVRYRSAFANLFSLDKSEWSFSKLQQFVRGFDGGEAAIPAWNALVASQERAIAVYDNVLRGLRNQDQDLASYMAELCNDARNWRDDAACLCEERGDPRQRADAEVGALEAAKEEIRLLQQEVEALREARDAVRTELADAQAVAAALEDDRARKCAELEAAHGKLRKARQLQDDAEQNARTVALERDASLSNAHNWYLVAADLQMRLNEVLTSTSWRMTRPLRGCMRLVRQPRYYGREYLKRLMHRIAGNPVAARALGKVTKLVPPLHQRLVSLATSQGVEVAAPEIAPVFVPHLLGQVSSFSDLEQEQVVSRLSARGRTLYAQLKRDTENSGVGK